MINLRNLEEYIYILLNYKMGNQCCISESSKIDEELPLQIRVSKHKEPQINSIPILFEQEASVPDEIAPIFQKNQEKVESIQELTEEEPVVEVVEEKVDSKLDILMHQLLSLHSQIWKFYQNHDIDSSIELLKQLEISQQKYCQDQSINSHNFSTFLQSYYNQNQQKLNDKISHLHLLTSSQIVQIKIQYKDILHYCKQIAGGDWQQSNCEGMRLCTRKEENSVGILIEKDIDVPFQIMVAILTEIDLFKEFVLDSEATRQELIFSRNCRIGYILNNFPIISKRQAFFQGIGYSRLRTHGEVFMFTRSIHDKPHLQQYLGYKAQVNPKYVQLNYKYFVVRYHPVRKNHGKLTLAMNADVGLNFLPNFILEFMVKDLSKQFLENVIKIGKQYKGSEWQKRIEKNPSLFNFYHDQIEEYLLNKK